MVRSIPEKTFEHWASMYVAHRFPLGGLWWPTMGEDISVEDLGTVPGKALLLEAKVPEQLPGGAHIISIDVPQLTKYLTSIVPVYYIFPVPPWSGGLSGSVWLGSERRADLAYRRAGHRWFGRWTRVCTAADLYAHLAPTAGSASASLKGLPRRHWKWRDFWTEFRKCGSSSLQSAYILDGPTTDPSRAELRDRLSALRRDRARSDKRRRDEFVDTLRERPRYVYVPENGPETTEQYRLAQDDDLTGSLRALLDAEAASELSVCHVPFTVLG